MKKKNNWVDEWDADWLPIDVFLPSTIALRQGGKNNPTNNNTNNAANVQTPQRPATQAAPNTTAKTTSFSIKSAMQKKEEVEVKKIEETMNISAERETFSQEALIKAWNNYTQFTQEKPVLQQTIQQCKPVLGTDSRIMLAVFNSSQEEIMNDEKIKISNYLRKELHNGAITLEIRICEASENAKSLTSKELFIKMLEHNPSLSKLTKTLNLELS